MWAITRVVVSFAGTEESLLEVGFMSGEGYGVLVGRERDDEAQRGSEMIRTRLGEQMR